METALFTLGHGTSDEATFLTRLASAGVRTVVDVRRFPGSRRWPWFGAAQMAAWLPAAGIAYVPAPLLGGRRTVLVDSPNVALRNAGFRGYADYMASELFRVAFDDLLVAASQAPTAIICAETLWWRCHRRLIADAAVLLRDVPVVHLVGDGRQPHKPTPGVRVLDRERVVYDAPSG